MKKIIPPNISDEFANINTVSKSCRLERKISTDP